MKHLTFIDDCVLASGDCGGGDSCGERTEWRLTLHVSAVDVGGDDVGPHLGAGFWLVSAVWLRIVCVTEARRDAGVEAVRW